MYHIRGRVEVHTGFWWGNLRIRDHLEDPDIGGRIILRWIFSKWDVGIDGIGLAQERNSWRAPVNAAMNLLLTYSVWNFLTS
jgi:hypothetical protein